MQKVAVYRLLSQRIQAMHNLPPYKSQVTINSPAALNSTFIFIIYSHLPGEFICDHLLLFGTLSD